MKNNSWRHWRFCCLIVGSLLSLWSCKAQQSTLTEKPQNSDIQAHIPQNYEVLFISTGDLNGDKYTRDILLVLRHSQEKLSQEPVVKRPLLILLAQADGTWGVAARNDNIIGCLQCGGTMGDAFQQVNIKKKGVFSIVNAGGSRERWVETIYFQYRKENRNWIFKEKTIASYDSLDPEKDPNISTTKEPTNTFFAAYDASTY